MNRSEFDASLRAVSQLLTSLSTTAESEAFLVAISAEVMSATEVAEYHGVSSSTAARWMEKGLLPAIKRGGSYHALRADVVRFEKPVLGNPNLKSR